MLPELFSIGPVTIHTFGFMLALAFLAIAWLSGKEYERRGYTNDDAWTMVFAAMVGGVLGAKLYYLGDHWGDTLADPRGMILSGAGLTYYGGLLGGALGVTLAARHRGLPLGTVANISAPMLALGYAIGRLGCFLNGDDYGRPTDVPWGMSFPKGSPPTLETVHPTQVYEAGAAFAIFFFLWGMRKRWQDRSWFPFGVYLVLAGIERFLVEFYRLNTGVFLGLTTAQLISIGLVVTGLLLIARRSSR